MSIEDSNRIIMDYLKTCTTLTDLVTPVGGTAEIYCPRLEENHTLPAVSFFTRGGINNPHIPGMLEPSVQFDCWANNPIDAREVYRALYDNLQGIQGKVVTVGPPPSLTTEIIWSAIEETQGQDLVDIEIPNYFHTLTFFRFMIKAE
ncbi:hypothetical protein ES703_47794 [subsurface metagenome]